MQEMVFSLLSIVAIALGLLVHAGAGSTIVAKLDRMVEARYASRPLIIDREQTRQNWRA